MPLAVVSMGYVLSCEEFGPQELLGQAQLAEQAGFERLWISDRFHPWNDEQGHSPFVWSVIGALSQVTSLPITTAVTCPTMRIHPAIIAQAAATAAVQCPGGFVLGAGSGEALDEHIFGHRWPPPDLRLEMLQEAVELIRALHRGYQVEHHGQHFTVEYARLYTLPGQPVPIYVSASDIPAARLAGKIGDGMCSTIADPELVTVFRDSGGGDAPAQGGFKVCWADTTDDAVAMAHRRWAHEQLPGDLGELLPTPAHVEQASQLVGRDAVAEAVPCGPDAQRHIAAVRQFVNAGYDEVYVQQIGPEQDKFFEAWADRVLPKFHQ